ncbi:MAG: lipid A biosynthesis acyltransferase [Acidobacteria bacterium]|nr:lipid A biosynthesis acyltransferase [Acidobacteriota bacterium]
MSIASFVVSRVQGQVERWDFAKAGRRGASLGRLFYRLDRRHREVALSNLAVAFPERDEGWREHVAVASFAQAGRTILELLWSPNLATAGSHDEFVRFDSLDNLRAALAGGKGAIVATCHAGNWELTGIAAAGQGIPLVALARTLDDPGLDAQLIDLRTRTGQRVIPKAGALRPTMRALRDGEAVALLTDQNTLRREAVFVPYFGKMAATTPAAAQLHLRTGAPILNAFSIPEETGYRVIIEPPMQIPVADDAAESITAAVTSRIEHYVRAYPEAWLWMHDRWRQRP